MMTLGKELPIDGVGNDLETRRASEMSGIEGLPRPCDLRTSGGGGQIKDHQRVGWAQMMVLKMVPGMTMVG